MRYGHPLLEDRLGELEPPYRSRGEAQVGRLLDRYGIPFFYEQPLLVLDRGRHRIWHPDFALPTYSGLVVEYAGMPDRPEYMAGIEHKKEVYMANQVPAVFIYPKDLRGYGWPERVVAQIRRAGQESPASPLRLEHYQSPSAPAAYLRSPARPG